MAHPTNVDIEMGIHRLRGYPSLAAFIASTGDGDKTTLIFKRFDELAARNLLYLQSQLAQLESQLGQFDQDDLRGDMDAKSRARNWQKFSTAAAEHTNGREQSRMELIMQIRKIMKEYRQALLFESTLASIPPPRKTVLEAFRLVFHNGQLGADESFPTLGGHDRALYDNREDLVTLKVQENQDRLTTFVQDRLGGLFPARTSEYGIVYVSGRAMSSFIAWFSTLLAASLLIGAIVVLYKVQSPGQRLGLIAAFTSVFAGSVGLLTNARRAELFGATAAYAAVLVVFVSGNLGEMSSS